MSKHNTDETLPATPELTERIREEAELGKLVSRNRRLEAIVNGAYLLKAHQADVWAAAGISASMLRRLVDDHAANKIGYLDFVEALQGACEAAVQFELSRRARLKNSDS